MTDVCTFSPLAPPVLAVWDLPGLGGRTGQELQPPRCCSHILPSGTCKAGDHQERPGVLLWPRVERKDCRPCSHEEILPQTPTGGFHSAAHCQPLRLVNMEDANILWIVSDWSGEPRVPHRSRLHPVPRWPVWRAGAGSDRPEVHGAEGKRGLVVLCLPWREQPKPLQAAVPQQDEQRGADGGREERRSRGGRASVWTQYWGT